MSNYKTWNEFIAFFSGWYTTPLSQKTGIPGTKIEQIEHRTQRTLPHILKEYLSLMGNHEILRDETTQDCEMPIARITEEKGRLRIYGENQDNWYCSVLEEDGELPDPPVYFESYGADLVQDFGYPKDALKYGKYLKISPSLNQFIWAMTARQIGLRRDPSPYFKSGVCGAYINDKTLVEDLIKMCDMKCLLEFPVGYSPYLGQKIIVIEGWGFATENPQRFEEVCFRYQHLAGDMWKKE